MGISGTAYCGVFQKDQEDNREQLLRVIRGISAQYEKSGGPYFLGGKLSMADIQWFPFVHRMPILAHYRGFAVPDTAEYAAYHRYVAAMNERASVKHTARPAQFFIDEYKPYAEGRV